MNSIHIQTPFTGLEIRCNEEAVVSVDFVVQAQQESTPGDTTVLMQQVIQQINDYCQSPQRVFDLPLELQGTEFQQRVWRALQSIPSGQVKSYGALARELGTSARAVGNACRQNPMPLIIPCHRVVAKQGIGGFAGTTAGQVLDIKRQLLRHEGVEID